MLAQEPARRGEQGRDHRSARLGSTGQRCDPRLRRRPEVIGREAAQHGGKLGSARGSEFVGVEAERQAEVGGGAEDAAALVG